MKKTFLFCGIFLFIVAIVLLKINIIKFPANFVRFFSNNVTSDFYSVSSAINNKFHDFSNVSHIIEENKNLKAENRKLYSEINELTEQIKENEIIERSTDFANKYNSVFAKVLTTNKERDNTIVINVGLRDGVDVSYPVIFEDGFLIGKIKKVSQNSSIVALTTNKETEISATISGFNHNVGIISGNYGLNFKFNYVSIKENIKIDDIVVSSGIDNNVPAGLIIGKVSNIDFNPTDFFQDIVVSPLVPFENFKIVSVIIPENDK